MVYLFCSRWWRCFLRFIRVSTAHLLWQLRMVSMSAHRGRLPGWALSCPGAAAPPALCFSSRSGRGRCPNRLQMRGPDVGGWRSNSSPTCTQRSQLPGWRGGGQGPHLTGAGPARPRSPRALVQPQLALRLPRGRPPAMCQPWLHHTQPSISTTYHGFLELTLQDCLT